MISLQVFYEGNVQGVGFRWSVRDAAKGFDVTGWVRNLSDGRVELNVTGEEEEVLNVAVQHAVQSHEQNDTPELREQLRSMLRDDLLAVLLACDVSRDRFRT